MSPNSYKLWSPPSYSKSSITKPSIPLVHLEDFPSHQETIHGFIQQDQQDHRSRQAATDAEEVEEARSCTEE